MNDILNAADTYMGGLLPLLIWVSLLMLVLYFTGVFKWWQMNYEECARDNVTKKMSITNQIRIWLGVSFIFVWVTTKYNIETVPVFKLVPQKMDLAEMALILTFLSGSYAVQQYLKKKDFNNADPVAVNINDEAQATVITAPSEPGKVNCPKAAAAAAAEAAANLERNAQPPFVLDKTKADPGVTNE